MHLKFNQVRNMAQYSSEDINKVLKYIRRLPRDLDLMGKIDFIYEEHIPNLQLSERDLRNILSILAQKGYVILEGYIEGTFITLLR